jgi:hypothetical protein
MQAVHAASGRRRFSFLSGQMPQKDRLPVREGKIPKRHP